MFASPLREDQDASEDRREDGVSNRATDVKAALRNWLIKKIANGRASRTSGLYKKTRADEVPGAVLLRAKCRDKLLYSVRPTVLGHLEDWTIAPNSDLAVY